MPRTYNIPKRSVFNYSYSKRYYLTHPWKFVHHFFQNLRHAYCRAVYGWTWEDAWNLNDWLLAVLPPMLRHIAENGVAYPGPYTKFDTAEKWDNHLHELANTLESLQEQNWESRNEIPVNDKMWYPREIELIQEREQLLIDTFKIIGENFNYYWD